VTLQPATPEEAATTVTRFGQPASEVTHTFKQCPKVSAHHHH
jgi:hypothetical protein